MGFSIRELETLETQVAAIEKDLTKAIFYRNQLELARGIATRKISDCVENISLLKQPGIVVSLNEFTKIKHILKIASVDLRKIDDDLMTLNRSVEITSKKLEELRVTIDKIKDDQEHNVHYLKDKNEQEK